MMVISRSATDISVECPLCGGRAEWVVKDCPEEQKGFHHWCYDCKHGWYVADLQNIVGENLRYVVSRGRTGKSPEQIKELIRNADKRRAMEEKDAEG